MAEEPADQVQAGAQGLAVVREADAHGVPDAERGAGGEQAAGLLQQPGAELVGADRGAMAQGGADDPARAQPGQ
ncbi:hypothetical protein AB5L52_41500 [Streptomyces sp. CG4]|uniref:hypothetical protein n=1 Tax=unclassified Streptomyces TaxID=2593676 RepID=UPI00331669AB